MLLADAPRYLDPSERQVFDSLAQKAMAAREDEQRREMAGRQDVQRLLVTEYAPAMRKSSKHWRV